MISRHARQSLSVRQATSLRTLSRCFTRSPLILQHQSTATTTAGHRCVFTGHARPVRRRLSDAAQRHVRERSLATAAGDVNFDSLPYGQMGHASPLPFQSQPLYSQSFQSFDPSMPLILPEPTESRPMTRMNRNGIPGDTEDLISVFEACLRVGKLERASLVLKRVNAHPSISNEERILLHNMYLRSNLQQMRVTPDPKQLEHLHQWYELQIRNCGLPHTAETVACMLKASLLSERGGRLKRLIKRYMGMAPGESGLKVLSMADILSDQDIGVITDTCPMYNYVPEAEEVEGQLEAQVEEASRIEPGKGTSSLGPELIPTPQRGEGLKSLRKGLEFLRDIQDVDVSKLPLQDQRDIQIQLERDSIGSAISRWRLENKNRQQRGINSAITGGGFGENSLPSHMAAWLTSMENRLKDEFKLIEASEQKTGKSDADLERCFYGPLIRQADPARLAAVTILTALNIGAMTGADKGVPVSKLILNISKNAEEDIEIQMKEQFRKKRKVQYTGAAEPTPSETSATPLILETEGGTDTSKDKEARNENKGWSLQARTQVGSILAKVLIENAKMRVVAVDPMTQERVSQYQPAFTHTQQIRKGKKTGVLILNSHLVEHLKKEPMGDYLAKHLPMIVEPKPWKTLTEGGFLESKSSVIRVQPGDVEQKLYTKAAIRCGDFDTVFKGLDVLGKTAWRVNNNVLTVMMEAWNNGVEIANMPPLNPNFEIPTEPDATEHPDLHRQWVAAVRVIENNRAGLHSQRCFMNLQLEIARAFRNQTLYFPHNVDYRGRAYPIPTYLNHMGADHTRGLLSFSSGKELGARGLRWLKIHLANVFGLDKASFDDREAFAMENVANIVDSATNPLGGNKWWLKAEEPWQCLATCFELKAAFDLPDPTKYVSHLPVQQDGTCNGLQHYAALGGDSWGAKQVNLEPGDKPADVYSAVAQLVKETIAEDAANNNPLAKIMQGKITRKVVKQTVMTNVYGVTFAGARKQVCKQIDALYPTIGRDNDTKNIVLASYVARHIFMALATMFRGAHDIQYWLGEAGGRICRALTPAQLDHIAEEFRAAEPIAASASKGKGKRTKKAGAAVRSKAVKAGLDELAKNFRSTVVWTTPLRMPVVQPYRKGTMKEIRTCLQAVMYPTTDQTDPVNRKKQLQGFPPNFIHSLDASHMLLSALKCHELGLSFAAVHDSFWTHAADVDVMNGVLRDAFIKIHEDDVVGRLAAELKTRHHGSLYLANIDPDSAVARKIKELRAKSNLSPKEELLLEHKRNTLRLSGNPWDLEAAKQIVTPASVYEDMAATEEDVGILEDVREIELGAVPDIKDDAAAATMSSPAMDDEDDLDAQPASKPAAAKSNRPTVPVWLPLTFPEVPKKVSSILSYHPVCPNLI
ncbi:DNA-directed RNA polymerase, mitochondrial [Geosmithia morbida]|uniref:DNA-directed RNA polymerase n=1 Tax=Geosmithia morbida TaxID=1094350 RepID=A0A9P4YWF2_9HYPO|nr:DNA-directed RNA polymerase, mitochondrial [Geosmithia morbida]KAF4123037.1 DNA-directed RNA polymerase, mitochondrial [Geosmithia morbida]